MMYRFLAAMLCLALLPHCCSTTPARSAEPQLIAYLTNVTVMLVEDDGEGGWSPSCSGAWISEYEFLTAYHCIESAGASEAELMIAELAELVGFSDWNPVGQQVTYMTHSLMAGKSVEELTEAMPGRVVKVSREKDLAVVRTGNSDHPVAEISTATPEVGLAVHMMGATGGLPYSYSPGWIGAVRTMDTLRGKATMVQVVGGAWRGNSGGGVFDMDGRLLGCTSFLANGTILTFHTAGKEIRAFLDSKP